jgi:hypothetical protein
MNGLFQIETNRSDDLLNVSYLETSRVNELNYNSSADKSNGVGNSDLRAAAAVAARSSSPSLPAQHQFTLSENNFTLNENKSHEDSEIREILLNQRIEEEGSEIDEDEEVHTVRLAFSVVVAFPVGKCNGNNPPAQQFT